MVLAGHVRNGIIVLDEPVELPEGTEVQVQVVAAPTTESARSLYDVLKPVIGQATGLPPDASQNIDHYLYGHPKQ